VLSRTGAGNTGTTLAGIVWAADHGANIANASIGGGFLKNNHDLVGLSPYINRIFNYANRKGMLIVVAAGNSTIDMDHDGNAVNTYCDAPHVVCVSAIGPRLATSDQNEPSYYTNFGRSAITVAAPGGNADAANGFTLSTWPWGNDIASWVWSYCPKYRIAGLTATGVPILTACVAGNRLSGSIGTSQASPHVAGEAASILAANPGMSASDLKQAIIDSSDDLGPAGTDPFYGKGRINVAKAHGL
jgi:subtilisin family serine protease